MTAAELQKEIAALRDSWIPVQVRDQYGGVLEVAGVEADLDNTGAEVALVILVSNPAAEQAAAMRGAVILCQHEAVLRDLPWSAQVKVALDKALEDK